MEPTKDEILTGYGRAQDDLDRWLADATAADLRRKSNGTKWTNEELLFHMVFGYMVVHALLRWSTSSAGSPHPSEGVSPHS